MLKALLILLAKDFKLLLRGGSGLAQALLLGFLIIFIFSLAAGDIFKVNWSMLPAPEALPAPEVLSVPEILPAPEVLLASEYLSGGELGSAVFWLASIFFILLLQPLLYGFEETWQARRGLLSMAFSLRLLWLAKTMLGFVFLLLAQGLFLVAISLFLGQGPANYWFIGLSVMLLANAALVSLASMLAPISKLKSGSQALLAVLFLPLCLPLLLRLMAMGGHIFSAQKTSFQVWMWHSDFLFVLAFAFIFVALGVLFFPFLYKES